MGYGIEYEFPCASLKKLHCVDQIIRDREQLEALIKKNATILMRYKRAQAKPYYKVYPLSAEMPMPVYHISLHASWLRLSEAIFAIDEGDVHRGLIILQEEMDFAKNKLLTNGYVIETMIATRHLLITAHVLAQFIDKPQLKPYISDPQLIALFQPLTNKQQQAMANTLKNERRFVVMNAYLATEKTIRELICRMEKIGFKDDIIVYFNQAEALGYPLKYDRLVSTNLDYQLFSQQIERALLVLPASSIKYQVEKLIKPQPLTIQAIYQKFGANNVLGGIGYEADKYSDYLYRFYDVNNYLWLLQVKLQMKQLDISQDKVVEFLSESGLKNPYSQQPLQWDSSTQILSSDWLGSVHDGLDGVRASVYIPFNE